MSESFSGSISDRKELKSAIRSLESLTDSRSVHPYRSAVEIRSKGGALRLRVSDGESEAIAEVKRVGRKKLEADVPARVFHKSINAFKDKKLKLTLKQDSDELRLLNNAESRKLGIKNMVSDFPAPLNLGERSFSIEIDSFLFAEALNKAIRFAGTDGTRPALETVAFSSTSFIDKDYLILLATDGHRLIEIPVPVRANSVNKAIFIQKPFLWPISSVKALAAEVTRVSREDETSKTVINEYEGGAEVLFGTRTWRSLGVNNTYPDTTNLFDRARGDNILYFKKEEMIDSLKALSAVSVGDTPVVLELDPSRNINIKYSVPGVTSFEEKLEESKYIGETHNIAFNPDFLTEACQLLDGGNYDDQGVLETKSSEEHQDKIKARLPGDANAVVLYGANYTRILLMPIRI